MRPFGDREKGWPRDAREGMGHPDAGDARRSFGAMRAVRAGVAVVAVLACVVATSLAWAHGSLRTQTDGQRGNACSSSTRVSHRASTCVHGWWDNTPPISAGHFSGRGSTFGAEVESDCDFYEGYIIVDVAISGVEDQHFHFGTYSPWTGKMRGSHETANVSNIYCCRDVSSLCYVDEVEAVNNRIKRWAGGTRYVYEDVATHQQRYDLCQSYPDIVYCNMDPSGDALTPPPHHLPRPYHPLPT